MLALVISVCIWWKSYPRHNFKLVIEMNLVSIQPRPSTSTVSPNEQNDENKKQEDVDRKEIDV